MAYEFVEFHEQYSRPAGDILDFYIRGIKFPEMQAHFGDATKRECSEKLLKAFTQAFEDRLQSDEAFRGKIESYRKVLDHFADEKNGPGMMKRFIAEMMGTNPRGVADAIEVDFLNKFYLEQKKYGINIVFSP